jgi:uncharacterized protein (DUF849 family)
LRGDPGNGEANMQRGDKAIISCAVTGSIHTPSMSPHLPVTPDEIVAQAVGAARAGAAILHLHARDPADGRPTQSVEVFRQILPRIGEQCDAVLNLTTGGGMGMSMEERLAPAHWARPELVSLNMGSMNFGVFQAARGVKEWRHDWEEPYLLGSAGGVYVNTFTQIDRIIREVGDAYGTRFEFECYDVGHLYTLAHFVREGHLQPPYFIQMIFGILGGIGADLDNVTHMVRIADRLFGDDYRLSVFASGRHQMRFTTLSAMLGGNVRVGLEDNLYLGKGVRARSNAEQVTRIREILAGLSIDIASPDEARAMLKLKGRPVTGPGAPAAQCQS